MWFDILQLTVIISVFEWRQFNLLIENIIFHFIWLLIYKINFIFISCLNHWSRLGVPRYWTLDERLKRCKEHRLSAFLFRSSPILQSAHVASTVIDSTDLGSHITKHKHYLGLPLYLGLCGRCCSGEPHPSAIARFLCPQSEFTQTNVRSKRKLRLWRILLNNKSRRHTKLSSKSSP